MPAIKPRTLDANYSMPLIGNQFPSNGLKIKLANNQTTGVGLFIPSGSPPGSGESPNHHIQKAMANNMVAACNVPSRNSVEYVCDGFTLADCTPDENYNYDGQVVGVAGTDQYPTNFSSDLSAEFTNVNVTQVNGTGVSAAKNLTYSIGFFAGQANDSVITCLLANAQNAMNGALDANRPQASATPSSAARSIPVKKSFLVGLLLLSAALIA